MPEENGKSEEPIEIQPLRGERPKNVTGEMKPRQTIELLRKMKREHTLEEDEESWREIEPYLR